MKNFKNWRLLGRIMFWAEKTLKSLLFGFVIFLLSLFILRNVEVAAFFGTFAAYMWLGGVITESLKRPDHLLHFCSVNLYGGLIMVIVSILGLIFFASILVITWPLLIAGIVLVIVSLLGYLMTPEMCYE